MRSAINSLFGVGLLPGDLEQRCPQFPPQGSSMVLRQKDLHKQTQSQTLLSHVCSSKNPFVFPKQIYLLFPGEPFLPFPFSYEIIYISPKV